MQKVKSVRIIIGYAFILSVVVSSKLLFPKEISASSTLFFHHTNHQGSVVAVTDINGEVAGENRYFPYGEDRVSSDVSRISDRKYTSQIKDTETDIYYYNARYYDPSLSTFLSADSVGGGNRFSYVAGNPINFTDPTGNWQREDTGETEIADNIEYINEFMAQYGLTDFYFISDKPTWDIVSFDKPNAEMFYGLIDINNNLYYMGVALDNVNRELYEGTMLALSMFPVDSLGWAEQEVPYWEGVGDILLTSRATVCSIECPSSDIQRLEDLGILKKYRRVPDTPEEYFVRNIYHELFHLYQFDDNRFDSEVRFLYSEDKDFLDSVFNNWDYGKEPVEFGPVLVSDTLYPHPEAFQVFAPELYELIYNTGFLRKGIFQNPELTGNIKVFR